MNFILPTISINIERWKWNRKYRVFVSNKGNFKDITGKRIKILVNGKGYLTIKAGYHNKLALAHRVIMETWRPIPNADEMTVDHLDHNKRNNDVKNLEWVTQKENGQRAINDSVAEPCLEISKQTYVDCTTGQHFETLNQMVNHWYQTDPNIRGNGEYTPTTMIKRLEKTFKSGGQEKKFAGHRVLAIRR